MKISTEISSPQYEPPPLAQMSTMLDFTGWLVDEYKKKVGLDFFKKQANDIFGKNNDIITPNDNHMLSEDNKDQNFKIGEKIKISNDNKVASGYRNEIATIIGIDENGNIYIELNKFIGTNVTYNDGKKGYILKIPLTQWEYISLVEPEDQYEDW